ncbi:SRPBCC family protein [Actinomycetospora succinea]|uniref:SRPBCC family protein n=1 Tax=Actinomycetospora succinea TaxID=663603 RepID=UPI0014151997|nr:SRPBCC family protein [Actinomycetospora succinea]
MTTVVNLLDTDASPETVFDRVADLRTEAAWNPAARRIDLLGAEPVGVGSRFEGTWLGLGGGTAEIVEYDRPRCWRTRCRFRGLDVDLVGDVEARGSGSRLTLTISLAAPGALGSALPALAAGMRVAGRANMRRLGKILAPRG